MKLIRAEWQKLTSSRLIWVLLAVLLAVNFALTLHTSRPQPFESTVREVYAKYIEDPEAYDAYDQELEKLAALGIRDENLTLPHTFYGSAEYDDRLILRLVSERADYLKEGQSAEIRRVIRITERRIDDLYGFSYTDDSYEVRSQKAVLAAYTHLADTLVLGEEYAHGYDVYLQNNTVSVFLFLFLLTAVTWVFLNDRSVGFDPILRVCGKGRGATYAAKLTVVCLLTVGAVLLFLATTGLATGIMQGYSSLSAPIQALPDFATVPYTVSVGGYLLMHTGLRIAGFLALSLFISVLAGLRLPYVLCFGGGVLFAGANVFVHTREYLGTAPAIQYVNLSAMTEGCGLLGFYRTAPLFGIPVSYPAACLLLSVLLCVGFASLCAVFYCRRTRPLSARGKMLGSKNVLIRLRERFSKQKRRRRPMPLCFYELKKTRIGLSVLIVALLLLAKGVAVDRGVGSMETYREALYYEYITDIQALEPAARAEYMTSERERLDGILEAAQKNEEAFENGSMKPDDYYAYYQTLTEAKTQDSVFREVESYVSYIDRKNSETGNHGNVIYTAGYEALFALPSDALLFATVLLVCVQAFPVEYQKTSSCGSCAELIRSTPNGRRKTFAAKLLTCSLIGLLLSVLFRLVSLAVVGQNYILSDPDATLYSIVSFGDVSSPISIRQYFLIDFAMQMFAGAALSALVCVLSFFCKRILACISVSLLLVAVPEILVQTVLPQGVGFSLLSLTAPQQIFIRSAQEDLWSGEAIWLILVCLLHLIVVAALTAIAAMRYNGTYKRSVRNGKRTARKGESG